jgi:hypothetical protein
LLKKIELNFDIQEEIKSLKERTKQLEERRDYLKDFSRNPVSFS